MNCSSLNGLKNILATKTDKVNRLKSVSMSILKVEISRITVIKYKTIFISNMDGLGNEWDWVA